MNLNMSSPELVSDLDPGLEEIGTLVRIGIPVWTISIGSFSVVLNEP